MPVDPFSSAVELAAAVRARRIGAAQLLEVHLDRIERHNPALNAICTLDEAGARRRTHDADAALARGELWGSLTQSKGGLPIGVQLVGRRWSEPELLALAQKVALITGPFTPPPAFKS